MPGAAIVVVPLYQLVYVTSGTWMSGQRDVVASHVLLLVIVAVLARLRGGSGFWAAAAGAALFVAVMTRPTYLLMAPFAALASWWGRQRRGDRWALVASDVGLAAAGFLGAAAIALTIAWPSGALAGWFEMAVRFNLEVYGAGPTPLLSALTSYVTYVVNSWHWYAAFAAAGAVLLWRHDRTESLSLLIALAATCVGSALVQGKGFAYHLGGVLPVLAFLMAVAIAAGLEAWRQHPRSLRHVAVGLLLVGIVSVGMARKTQGAFETQIEFLLGARTEAELLAAYESGAEGASMADVVAAARYLDATTPASATVLTWDRPVAINFLAKRRCPTRFINTHMLEEAHPPFSLTEAWTLEIEAVWETVPPMVIVIPRPPHDELGTQTFPKPNPSAAVQTIATALDERYEFDRAFGSLELHRLTVVAEAEGPLAKDPSL